MDSKISLKNILHTTAFLSVSIIMGCGDSSDPEPPTPTPNAIPVAVDDSIEIEFNVATEIMVLANDSDTDGDTLSITSISYSGDGTAVIASNAISFTPATDFLGVEQISYTVSDGKGGEASASLTIDVGINLAIHGKVTDGPIANASVTVSVGDEQFTAISDDAGNYQVALRAHSNSLVEIAAQGGEDQSFVLFNSILGQVVGLATAAGDDAILAKDELTRVNVTNLSTAESVFVKALNNDEPLADDADLVRLLNQLDSGEVMKAAAAIKLVVDNENYNLPEGVSDTLAFISDSQMLEAFVQGAGEDLTAAIQAIVADAELTASTDLTAFLTNDGQSASFILFEEGRKEGSYLQRNRDAGSLIQFNPDGTGSLHLAGGTEPMSFAWQVDGNKLELSTISYSESIFHAIRVDGATVAVYGVQAIQLQLSLININATFADFSVDATFSASFADYPQENATGNMLSQWKLQKLPLVGNVTQEQLTNGNAWYMPAYRPDIAENRLMFDGLVFAQDGSGSSASGNSFSWAFDEQGLLTLSYADESQVVYHSFYLNDGSLGSATAVYEKSTDAVSNKLSLFGTVVEQDTSLSITDDMLAKRWHQFEVGEHSYSSRSIFWPHFRSFRCDYIYDGASTSPCANPNNYRELVFSDDTSFSEQYGGALELGFAFYEDGYAHEMAFNEGDFGSFQANQQSLSNLFSSWQRVDEENALLILQGYDYSDGGDDPFCDFADSDCLIYFHYQVHPLYQVGDRLYVYYQLKHEDDDIAPNALTDSLAGVTFYTLAEPVITQAKASSSATKLSEVKRQIIK